MSLQNALTAVAEWPAPTAAVAVISREGTLATHGPQDHPFPLASVTKPLAALCMPVAVDEGALELSDPADESLIPGASLRHLLSHASGLAPERRLRSFAPGVRRVYSNVGIELAAELVSHAVDMPFASYVDESVVAALHLHETSLRGSAARDGVASVRDLARVVHELLVPSGLLHPSTLDDATSVQYPGLRGILPGFGSQNPNDWGLGFEIRGTKHPHWTGLANSPVTYGHFGQSGTFLWVDPAVGLGVVGLSDCDFGPWAAQAWPALSDAILAAVA